MKNKFLLVLTFFISFLFISNVRADVVVNGTIGNGQESDACTSSICASTIQGYYGLEVKLCNKSNNKCTKTIKLTNSDFTFTTPSTCDKGKLNFCWGDYFKNLNVTELNRILAKLDTTAKESTEKYLLITPLVGIDLNFKKYSSYLAPNTYFYGTVNEVVQAMDSAGNYVKGRDENNKEVDLTDSQKKTVNNKARGFTRQHPNNCPLNGIGCTWNVLRNYYTNFKLSKAVGNYKSSLTNTDSVSAYQFYKGNTDLKYPAYSASIYGKIAIYIEEYVHKVRYYNNISDNQKYTEYEKYYYGDSFTTKSTDIFKRTGFKLAYWRVKRSDGKWYYSYPKNLSSFKAYTCTAKTCKNGWHAKDYNSDDTKSPKHAGKKTYDGNKTMTLGKDWFYTGDSGGDVSKGPFTYTFYAQWERLSSTIKYDANAPKGTTVTGTMANQPVEYEKNFKVKDSNFKIANRTFSGWTVQRASDKKWYVASKGWFTESEITKNNYKKHVYKDYTKEYNMNSSWLGKNGQDTFTFYAQWNLDRRQLTINKVYKKSDGKYAKVTQPAQFGIYTNANCTGEPIDNLTTSTNGLGVGEITLNSGVYYIKETKAPDGYVESDKCQIVDLTNGDVEIDVENVKHCESELNKIKTNPNYVKFSTEYKRALVELYQSEKHSYGNDFRKLLNFNDPKCEIKTNCSTTTNEGCLSVSYKNDNSFSDNDWSCYNETMSNGQKITGFCSTTVDITSNITPVNGYHSITNAGQLLMANKNPVATSTVKTICYELDSTLTNKKIEEIPMIKLGDTLLNMDHQNSIITFKKSGIKYEGELKYTYSLPTVYAKKISGRLKDDDNILYDSNCLDCKNLGTGIASRFDSDQGSIKFEYWFKANSNRISGSNNDCKYKVNREIIKYDKEPKGQMQLEFRTIDTKEPFSRTAKSNWCTITNGIKDCTSNNKIITDTIKNKTNSYGMNNGVKQTPKYTITLSSSDITNIREYNKNNKYDDYLFKCEDGVCKSNFLTSLKDGAFGSKLITY